MFVIVTVIISCRHKAGKKKKIHPLHFKLINLFWCVNLCRGSSKLLSSHNAKPEQELQSPCGFFLQGWAQTKSRLIYWIRETIPPVTPHCLRKWTRHMNEQCQISLVPVHFCNSCVYECEYVTAKSTLHIRALPGNLLTKRSYLKLKIDSCQFSSRYFYYYLSILFYF